jgi:TetR/AcrR family tetracycline transcriptional repressor
MSRKTARTPDGTERHRRAGPPLSRDCIVRTALDIIDRDGLAALSMRNLGSALGVDPMAIYYHVPDKVALFDGVVEAIYGEFNADAIAITGDWRDQFEGFMRAVRRILRRHPNALPVIATRPVNSTRVYAILERGLSVLVQAGFPSETALRAITCMTVFTIGHSLAEVGQPVGGEPTGGQAEHLPDATVFPHAAAALAAGYQPDTEYDLGLNAMLDGLEALRVSTAHGP